MSTFVNLTPHPVNIINDGEVVASYSSQGFARVGETIRLQGFVMGDNRTTVNLSPVYQGEVEGLPEPEPETVYIVSRLTAQAVKGREDIVFPLGEVRDEKGRILGVRGFGYFPVSDA